MDNQLDFEDFEKHWKKRHKASLPRKASVSSFAAIFWIAFWLIVATGAAVFSAAHTIPAAELTLFRDLPYRSALASSVFVIVELVIFGAAVFRHKIWWMKWFLLVAMLVALIANTSSSVQAVSENGGNMLNQIAGVLVSIIAPFTALAAGEVLHLQLGELTKKQKIADEAYLQEWKDVEAKINTAFTKAEKEFKAAQTKETERQAELERLEAARKALEIDVNLRKFTSIDRPTPKMKKALEWLREHPEHLETESRELANLIGVSHTLANEARKSVKAESENGHK